MTTRTLGRALHILVLLLGGAAGFAGGTPGLGRQEYTEVHMGMPVRITLYAGVDKGRAAAREAFERVATLDRMMSDYRLDSELRRLSGRTQAWVGASAELIEVLARAAAIAEASEGAFDPTIGPVVALWRRSREMGRLPDPDELRRARALVGWRLVELDPGRGTIRLTKAGMRLDLGGIAKGYILQQAMTTLRAHAVSRALVVSGGDIVAGDPPPGAPGWRVDVPGASAEFTARARALAGAALATSGPTVQYVVIDGTRYSHVIDPRTGLGSTRGTVAHVIARDGATADALATALSVLEPAGARALLARIPAVLVSLHAD
jgi:thiamine biosynthesis lipoprotein